jgi:hypothetical protein
MDGRLWTELYRAIRRASKGFREPQRRGRPRVYRTDEVLAVWALAAMMDWSVTATHRRLSRGPLRWWLRRHWGWPARLPSVATLTRRARDGTFRRLLRLVLRRVRQRLARTPTPEVVIDGTPLCTGWYSRDPESTYTKHGKTWYRGYMLHSVCDERGVVWAWHVTSAHVQELTVARRLVRQLALIRGDPVRVIIGDTGYDSEPLHGLVSRRLRAQLLAPLNFRGGPYEGWQQRTPYRAAAHRRLQTPEGTALLAKRSAVERWHSWFKGTSKVSMLPYHVRRLHRVRRWVDLKLLVFLVHRYLTHKDLRTAA